MSSFVKYSIEDAPESSVETLTSAKEAFGFVPNLLGYMAESPVLLKSYMTVFGFLGESSLSPTEQQVVLMTVSRFHECRYCMTGHTKMSEMQGIDTGVLNAIRDDTPIGDPKLGALRGFTRKMVEQRGVVSQTQLRALYAVGYTRETALEVITAIAFKIMSNFTNHVVGTELDPAAADKAWRPPSER